MKRIIRFVSFVFVAVALFVPLGVRADMAPPAQPPGFNPEPGAEITQVRMMAETVLIDVQASAPVNSLGQAKVTADFTMRNLGTETENMAARFPIGTSDGYSSYPEINDLRVKVDGKSISTRRVMQLDPIWELGLVPWSEFDVTFPPNQDVQVQVTYTIRGTGEYPYVAFYYIFHTGAGWRDTIGSADLIVRLPYEANLQNIIFDESTGWSRTTPGGALEGKEVKWHFENFEPARENDFEISLIMPSAWRGVLNEKANIENNPNDGEAWGRLGKLHKEMFFFRRGFRHDAGGQELYEMSVQAYEQAVTLKPDDALWHAGFADLLAVHAYYASQEGEDTNAEMLRSMQEIDLALALAPNDSKVREIAETIYYLFPNAVELLEDGYDFLWLTATPVVAPTETVIQPEYATSTLESAPPAPTATLAPVIPLSPTPMPVPVPPTARNPLCGVALIAPLVSILWVGFKRRKSTL